MHTYVTALAIISQGTCVASLAPHRAAGSCADAGEGLYSRPYVELPADYDDRGAPYCSAPWGAERLPSDRTDCVVEE